MNKIYANKCDAICLGRQGENLATQVIFDLSDWIFGYGTGTAELIAQRAGDEKPYPVSTDRQGNQLIWAVSDFDTESATSYGRSGRCELRYYVGDILVKSRTWQTTVSKAMDTPSSTRPPAADQGWVDTVVAASASAQEAAKKAEEALSKAPVIGEEGNWYIWDSAAGKYVDTGCYSGGSVPYIGANGNWYVGQEDSGIPATGPSGKDGADGQDGVGIRSVVQTTTSTQDGGANVLTITKTDGTTSTFSVRNGSRGSTGPAGADGKDGAPGKDGADGAAGPAGADGYTPQRGVDYWTEADIAAIKSYVDEAILGGAW